MRNRFSPTLFQRIPDSCRLSIRLVRSTVITFRILATILGDRRPLAYYFEKQTTKLKGFRKSQVISYLITRYESETRYISTYRALSLSQ